MQFKVARLARRPLDTYYDVRSIVALCREMTFSMVLFLISVSKIDSHQTQADGFLLNFGRTIVCFHVTAA